MSSISSNTCSICFTSPTPLTTPFEDPTRLACQTCANRIWKTSASQKELETLLEQGKTLQDKEATPIFERAVNHYASTEAMFRLGQIYSREDRIPLMHRSFSQAHAKGHPEAMLNLAYYYDQTSQHREVAQSCYQEALRIGNKKALVPLLKSYCTPMEGQTDVPIAAIRISFDILQRASEHGIKSNEEIDTFFWFLNKLNHPRALQNPHLFDLLKVDPNMQYGWICRFFDLAERFSKSEECSSKSLRKLGELHLWAANYHLQRKESQERFKFHHTKALAYAAKVTARFNEKQKNLQNEEQKTRDPFRKGALMSQRLSHMEEEEKNITSFVEKCMDCFARATTVFPL